MSSRRSFWRRTSNFPQSVIFALALQLLAAPLSAQARRRPFEIVGKTTAIPKQQQQQQQRLLDRSAAPLPLLQQRRGGGAGSSDHSSAALALALKVGRGGADYGQLATLAPIPPNPTYNDKCNARANFVKFILHSRLEYVKRGKRARDFVRWVRQHRGDASPILNDMDEDDPDSNALAHAITNEAVPPELEAAAIRRLRHDPFAADRMNLDLVLTSQNPQDCFDAGQLPSNEGNQPPSYFQLCCRALRLGLHFAPVWSTAGLALVSREFRERVWYKWLATAIGSSGAAWIKWGQWSSTRNDMFPDALCEQLAGLHASAPAHSSDYSEQQLEKALGLGRGTLGCVFDEFDPRPLASGSIAQVRGND